MRVDELRVGDRIRHVDPYPGEPLLQVVEVTDKRFKTQQCDGLHVPPNEVMTAVYDISCADSFNKVL